MEDEIQQYLFGERKKKPPKPKKPRASSEDRILNMKCAILAKRYDEGVRLHNATEKLGIVRQMRRLVLDKGILLEDIERALLNYAQDPYVISLDQRARKHIRQFFTESTIAQWQTPMPVRAAKQRTDEYQLSILDRLDAALDE